MGEVQKQVSEQFQHCLDLQSDRMDLISESANKSQKSAEQNAELLQNLLLLVLKYGGNFKQLRVYMELWKTAEYQEDQREYEQMNRDLMQEVSLSIPAVTEPENAAVSLNTSVPPISAPPIFSSPNLPEVPRTGEVSMDMGLRSEWV